MSTINLKNFAKIKDSNFKLNDITVFAGKPGSGKSYIMKFQYAYTEAMSSLLNGKYMMQYALMDGTDSDQSMLKLLKGMMDKENTKEIDLIFQDIDDNDYLSAYSKLNSLKDESLLPILENILVKFANKQKDALLATETEKFDLIFKNILKSIFSDINQINTEFSYKSADLELSYSEDKLNIQSLEIDKNVSNAIFVETPLILEFENFLPKERFKIPYHIDSLLQELNKNDFSFTSKNSDDFIRKFQHATENIISGNIVKTSNAFSFESDSNRTFNIVNASSGIKSIGLLQYLVTNKSLKKGSTLYWEEPEVHLHPTWQLKMVDLFIELMNAGIKVVFSTHSPFMADYLNAKSQKDGFKNKVAFNLLNEDNGIVNNTILDESNWELMQNELMDSFEDIMWQYL